MSEHQVEPHVFVIIGATGDLTRRKLLPALYHLRDQGILETRNTLIVGAALSEMGEEGFRLWAFEGLQQAGGRNETELRAWCEGCLYYQPLHEGELHDYEALALYIRQLERTNKMPENRVFYLALPPDIVPIAMERLDQAGLLKSQGWVRVVFEKPFGRDFHSARHLNTTLHRYIEESQIYRIDHYLGKETVQNLLAFRFANPIFESLWKRDSIENVQITVAEDLGVEHRGAYYQQAGAFRDMVQNHLTQLMTVVAMEVPASFDAAAIQNEKTQSAQFHCAGYLSGRRLRAIHVLAGRRPDDSRLPRGTGGSEGLDHGDVCRAEIGDSQLAMAGRALLSQNGQTPPA